MLGRMVTAPEGSCRPPVLARGRSSNSLRPVSAQPADRPHLYRRATAAALVAAPLLLVADNLLHPEEFQTGEGNEARQLADIAEHVERWQIAHILGFFALILYVAAVLGLAYFVGRRSP